MAGGRAGAAEAEMQNAPNIARRDHNIVDLIFVLESSQRFAQGEIAPSCRGLLHQNRWRNYVFVVPARKIGKRIRDES